MATGLISTFGSLPDSWVEDLFCQPSMIDKIFHLPTGPTVESIERDVSKLRSVSPAGHKIIVDRRMQIASVGPYRDEFYLPGKDGRYPALMLSARQSGKTWSIRHELKQKD